VTPSNAVARLPGRAAAAIRVSANRAVGGPERMRVVIVLACVLALESADLATVGAAAPELEAAFHISNAQLGLLAAISAIVGAVATMPAGALADRVRRVHLLAAAVALWALAMAACAASTGYTWMLASRLGLGAVTAAAGPTIASLTGDWFAPRERGKIYGYVLSGELVGAGVGFVVSGSLAGAVSWRWAFAVLVPPAVALAVVIWRGLSEPARGGQSRLAPTGFGSGIEGRAEGRDSSAPAGTGIDDGSSDQDAVARSVVADRKISAVPERVLHEDPTSMSLWRAVRYVLSIPTNRWLICASALGYFFFAGMRTFALVFVEGRFGVGQPAGTAILFCAGLGSLAGVLIAGRVADRMIRQGKLNARLVVGAAGYIAAAVLLLAALLMPSVLVALPILILAAAALSAPNPPLDAARLDVMPSGLWGRAEGVRTLLRQTAQGVAPILFGATADFLTGGTVSSQTHISAAATGGLQQTFLLMLVPLAGSGILLLVARRRFTPDVATAIESERAGGGFAPRTSGARTPAGSAARPLASAGAGRARRAD
jgi:MFS family permease